VPRVRFQLAFTLGEASGPEIVSALAKLARRAESDTWAQSAVLSSCGHTAPALLETLAHHPPFADSEGAPQFLTRVAALVGARASDAELARALGLLEAKQTSPQTWQVAILEGLGQGLHNSGRRLNKLWQEPPPGLQEVVAKVARYFQQFAAVARDGNAPMTARLAATRMLAYGPYDSASTALQDLLAPQSAPELQLAAIR